MSENGAIYWTNERRRLGELVPWPINPRQIKKAEAERLNQSLDEFSQVETIAIGPENQVYNGHQRLNVWMQEHGPDFEVDVRVASRHLGEDERKKLTVFLHKGAAGEWDFDLLANNFEVDDLLDWGFDEKELDLDLWATDEPPEDPGAQIDRAEELREKWGVESGQLWKLGEHRLICGDCTDAEVVARVMDGEKAGAVVTDPPYGINREGIENDDPEGLRDLYDGCLAVMPIIDAVVIATLSPAMEWMWLDCIRGFNHNPKRLLWMHRKAGKTFPWRGWVLAGDAIRVSTIGQPSWGEPSEHNYDCYIRDELEPRELDGFHTTIKPLWIFEDLANHTSGIIFDPFLGSGTTLIACERLNRKCRAVEISPAYCAVALQRWHDMTGEMPELITE